MSSGTITLFIYIFLLVPLMLLGYYFARRKMFKPQHQLTMTAIVILNWILIVVVMLTSYSGVASEIPENISEPFVLLPTIHGIIGLIAQLSATYLVLLMWTENTPFERIVLFRIKNIKTPMRVTLSLWLITVLLGFGVYGVWYGGTTDAADSPPPVSTEEVNDGIAPEPSVTEDAVPEPATTEEASDGDATDAAEDAADDATDAAEDAADDATDAAEDATDDAEDAADD